LRNIILKSSKKTSNSRSYEVYSLNNTLKNSKKCQDIKIPTPEKFQENTIIDSKEPKY
jgi:hypothetical protein